MAFLSRRPNGRIEIRETLRTPRGPRARTLASFRGVLSVDVLEQAEARASRPLDRARLQARARELGIVVADWRECRPARELLALLRRGERIDPALARRLRDLLEPSAARSGESREESAEWVGASELERGEALRGLLRLSDRVLQSRGELRAAPRRVYPRFRSRKLPERAA